MIRGTTPTLEFEIPFAVGDAYSVDSKWSTYAAKIRAIEDYPDITGG